MDYCSFFSFALLLLILNSLTLSSSNPFFNFTTDENALLAFKNTITSDPNGVVINNWSTNTSICYWIGVSCGPKHHRVTALNVSGFNLGGIIAPHLGNLTFLRSLDISFNHFTGSIPSELSNLRRLKEINAGDNSLAGEIPPWFGALSQLQHIILKNNTFSGTIPLSLFNISKLQALDMEYNFLDGNLPEEIGNFSYLEILKLGNNQFTGSIPNGIFNMASLMTIKLIYNRLSGKLPDNICSNTPKLRTFSVSVNQLYGEIPANIYKCGELEYLYLPMNNFSGNIPNEIWSLKMLRILSLFANNFQGHISKQVENLTYLEYLYLHENNLTGELPDSLANLAYLAYASVRNNSLFGSIPPSVFNMSALIAISFSFNEFSGSLPSNIGFALFNLEELYLSHNSLSGEIPRSITNASMLTQLEMTNNLLSGSIPDFSNLRDLQILRIWGNNLTGSESPAQELGFLSLLTNCRYLEEFDISLNPLNGILPTSVGNLSTSLQNFFADRCNLKGVIPSEIGNVSSLLCLDLYGNQMTGVIPTTIGKLKQVQRMYLNDNQLHGYIPNELCLLSNLGDLDLSDNMLTSEILECFGGMTSLRKINLGSNKLNSTIPSNLWNLRDLLTLNLSSNYLSGQLSSQIGNLRAINQIDLSFNHLEGDIPSSLDSCESVEVLSLSNNKFRGSIPQSLGKVRGLMTLDLSNNNLSGLIPKSLEDLQFLQHFNVSYNKLEGEIPNGGCFANFTTESFVHNLALCGATRFQVPPCSENHGGSRSKRIAFIMKYIVPPFIATLILAVVALVLMRTRKQIKIPPSTDISLAFALRNISYRELVQGTDSFSETNLLGRGSFGSVFKGTLSDGLNVAVKVFSLQFEGVNKSFDTESEILSTVRHRNLVRVIGCCTNMEFKALVLAYMPNGSLEKWLYSDNYCVDLEQRLEIAIDVALALEYLHHGHTFTIVHCDIKPSNVLLDEDMVAHVGDFGISKLFDGEEAMIHTKTLATIGYAAPEYGSEGKVSTNGDVYSYGILLLEMFTGKKPTDDMFCGQMSLKEWVSKALLENAITEIVDPSLLSIEDGVFSAKKQCVSSIFDLAVKCLAFSPDERINMIQVVAALQKIKHKVTAQQKSKAKDAAEDDD